MLNNVLQRRRFARLALCSLALLELSCGDDNPEASAEPLPLVECGLPVDPERPCCPAAWVVGGTCTPRAHLESCWSACARGVVSDEGEVSSVRSQYSCPAGQVESGLGLFDCTLDAGANER